MPFPLVTTFETAGTYKKWQWPYSAHITYTWHALLLWHTYLHTYIHIYIYIYRTSSNLYIPDSVSLASLARQLVACTLAVLLLPVRTKTKKLGDKIHICFLINLFTNSIHILITERFSLVGLMLVLAHLEGSLILLIYCSLPYTIRLILSVFMRYGDSISWHKLFLTRYIFH